MCRGAHKYQLDYGNNIGVLFEYGTWVDAAAHVRMLREIKKMPKRKFIRLNVRYKLCKVRSCNCGVTIVRKCNEG